MFHGVGFSNFVEWDNLGQLFTKSPNDAITVEVDVKIIESRTNNIRDIDNASTVAQVGVIYK